MNAHGEKSKRGAFFLRPTPILFSCSHTKKEKQIIFISIPENQRV